MRYLISYMLLMSWTHNSTKKQLSIANFAIVPKDSLFWLSIVTSPQLICDVTQTCDTGIVKYDKFHNNPFSADTWGHFY